MSQTATNATTIPQGSPEQLQVTLADAHAFMGQFQTITLATCNAQGLPEASYATFVQIGHKFYIYVSELASHCANLQATGQCTAMFIENEEQAKTIFARRRLVLQCKASEIARDQALFTQVMDAFREKFGKFIDMIAPLTDFHLYELSTEHGSFVSGFAKAFYLAGEDLSAISHRNETGHQNSDEKNAPALQALAKA